MRKLWKRIIFILLIVATFWLGTVVSDKQKIQDNLLRLHVIANSDSVEDQSIKLQVRDAITQKLEDAMAEFKDIDSAKAYIQENLGELQKVANDVLIEAGDKCRAVVTLAKSAFPQRDYETFSLPAGVYESLRVTIGDGEGQNWWCVVFPSLCVSATTDGFEDTAVSAGFSDRLAGTLTGRPQHRIRFFVLDCFGWIENLFYQN
jgi:stage II sporulation protein R